MSEELIRYPSADGGLASSLAIKPLTPAAYKAPDYQSMLTEFNPAQMDALKTGKQIGLDGTVAPDNWSFSDFKMPGADSMQSFANLGGLAMELLAYSDKKKYMNAQTAGLKQNIAQQKVNNDFRADARDGINVVMAGGSAPSTVNNPPVNTRIG